MEGSFDNDVLIGNGGANSMLGQPGVDSFFGNGGDDVIDARDGVRDDSIQCGPGKPPGAGQTGPRPFDRPRPHRFLRPVPGQVRRRQARPPGPGPGRLTARSLN